LGCICVVTFVPVGVDGEAFPPPLVLGVLLAVLVGDVIGVQHKINERAGNNSLENKFCNVGNGPGPSVIKPIGSILFVSSREVVVLVI
jgi:hypothetical protein